MVACKYGGFAPLKPKVERAKEFKERMDKRAKTEEINSLVEVLTNKLSVVELDKLLKYIKVDVVGNSLRNAVKRKLDDVKNSWKDY